MKLIKRNTTDERLLRELTANGLPPKTEQPDDYAGFLVLKPWGYEFQVFDNAACSVWLACLRPDRAVSMHCHQRKQAAFIPLSGGVTFRTLGTSEALQGYLAIEEGVFHSQENNSGDDAFFLEYEWPSEKSDLVRYKDRYGRTGKGYEGKSSMRRLVDVIDDLGMPDSLKLFARKAA